MKDTQKQRDRERERGRHLKKKKTEGIDGIKTDRQTCLFLKQQGGES